MPISIEAHSLSKRLGPNQALVDISISFEAGFLHGLIGPEGAGKTTLLRTLVQLLRPDQGKVIYRQNSSTLDFAELRSQIAYMPQQQSLYPDLSIDEHLQFFRELYQIPEGIYRKRASELLHMTRLEKFKDRAAGRLSGGMYKKLGLMCALLQSPKVILLDEPTNGVDPISRRELWELLYDLAKKKILIVVTTAYMDEAERCGKVHLLESGRLVAHGEPKALLLAERVESFDAFFIKKASRGNLYEQGR